MTTYPCGRDPRVPTEMQLFFKHREVSLALCDLMVHVAGSDVKPVLAKILDAVAVRRSPDKTAFGIGELTGLIVNYLAQWIPTDDGEFGLPDASPGEWWAQIELWWADARPPVIMFVLGQAAVSASIVSADHAQQHAINLERGA